VFLRVRKNRAAFTFPHRDMNVNWFYRVSTGFLRELSLFQHNCRENGIFLT